MPNWPGVDMDTCRAILLKSSKKQPPDVLGPHASPPRPSGETQPLVLGLGLADKTSSRWWSLAPPHLRPGSSKKRIIVDVKSVAGLSLAPNERAIGPSLHMYYFSQRDLYELIAFGGANCVLCYFDVKSAYSNLRLRQANLWGFVCKTITREFGEEYWCNLTIVFGWESSEKNWQLFASILPHLMRSFKPDGPGSPALLLHTTRFVDNFFVLVRPEAGRSTPSSQRVADTWASIEKFIALFGIPAHEDGFGRTFHQLGLDWCSETMTVSVPANKLAAAKWIASDWCSRKEADADALESLVGMLSWLSVVYPTLKSYLQDPRKLQHAAELEAKFASASTIALTPIAIEAFNTIFCILSNADGPVGSPISPSLLPGHPPVATWRADGGTKLGCGAVNLGRREYFSRPWTRAERARAVRKLHSSSTFCESLALLSCVLRWATPGLVVLETDSNDLASAWQKGWSSDPQTNLVLREARVLAAEAGMFLQLRHIERESNYTADALSTLDLTAFKQWAVTEFGADIANALRRVD